MRRDLTDRDSFVNRAQESDRRYLEDRGYVVLVWDFPGRVLFCQGCYAALREADAYRADLIVYEPVGGSLWIWDTKTRDREIGCEDEIWLEVHKLDLYRRISEKTGLPVTVSLHYRDGWAGFAKIDDLVPMGNRSFRKDYGEGHSIEWRRFRRSSLTIPRGPLPEVE